MQIFRPGMPEEDGGDGGNEDFLCVWVGVGVYITQTHTPPSPPPPPSQTTHKPPRTHDIGVEGLGVLRPQRLVGRRPARADDGHGHEELPARGRVGVAGGRDLGQAFLID